MRALILCDVTYNVPTELVVRWALNRCYSMGIKPQLLHADATNPTVDMINNGYGADGDPGYYDMVIIPSLNSVTRSSMSRFTAGAITKPVFVMSLSTIHATIKGINPLQFADTTADYFNVLINKNIGTPNEENTVTLSRRFLEDKTLESPAAFSAIVSGGDAPTVGGQESENPIVAWSYTADGSNFVYYCGIDPGNNGQLTCPWHLLVQTAIDDGVLSKPPLRAPFLLLLDHINDAGETLADGGIGGWQENPEPLKTLGDTLRANRGIAYASIESAWEDGSEIPGIGVANLRTYLDEYQDVFKVNPYHHHPAPHNTLATDIASPMTTGAGSDARAKADIATNIAGTVASIGNYNMTPDYSLGHFALDRSNDFLWQLASPQVSYLSSPDGTVEQAGYGMKLARIGDEFESWPADTRTPGVDPFGYSVHWLKARRKHRGILFQSGADGGATADQTTATKSLWWVFRAMMNNIQSGTLMYFHAEDFEDVAWRTANLATPNTSGGDLTATYTQTAVEYMAGYCAACPDTTNFGADINDYIR